MTASRLEKSEWHLYFGNVSRILSNKRVEIEVESLAITPRIEKKWLTLLGIFYDRESDTVMIACEYLNHIIREPRDVFVNEAELGLVSMEIFNADELPRVLRLRNPLMLSTREWPHWLGHHEFYGSGRR
jgi:hypothetical protein